MNSKDANILNYYQIKRGFFFAGYLRVLTLGFYIIISKLWSELFSEEI